MDKCDSKTILKQNRLKLTKQRIIIMQSIIESEKIFSALTLQEKVGDSVDLATIYRILSLFLKKKIIREVSSNENTKLYEISCIHNPVHPHFYCNKCKKIICLDAIEQKEINKLLAYSKDNKVENITIQFVGICSNCQDN